MEHYEVSLLCYLQDNISKGYLQGFEFSYSEYQLYDSFHLQGL